MVGVLKLLRDIARQKPDYVFMDETRRAQAEKAVAQGVACILQTQIVVNGKKTVWCAQHDEVTLAPAPARKYELVSFSGFESVEIVHFLLGEKPTPEIIAAVEGAVEWFKATQINGIKWFRQPDKTRPQGFDMVVVADKAAPPLWARFYDIATNRPIFVGRDGVVKYRVAEIEAERRNGYRWYVDTPNRLLNEDYPKWRDKLSQKSKVESHRP